MPTLPLPVGGAALHGGDLPVSDGTDVLAEFPQGHRRPTTAPVRDAICAALAEIHKAYQDEVAQLFAQADPLRATGDELYRIADEHEVTAYANEDPSDLRDRLFQLEDAVTPAAIAAAVNSILAQYTTAQCQIVEPELDGWFVEDGNTSIGAFIPTSTPGGACSPHYADRLYPDDAAENGGFVLPNADPRFTIVANGSPRSLLIWLPELSASDSDFSFCVDASDSIMAIFSGTQDDLADADSSNFIFTSSQTSDDAYASIVGVVDSLKGQGITWTAVVDPTLV